MSTAPLGCIANAVAVHQSATKDKSYGTLTPRDRIPRSMRMWILIPLITFQSVGIIMLIFLTFYFISTDGTEIAYAWPALILGFAGMSVGFVTSVRKILDVVTFDV